MGELDPATRQGQDPALTFDRTNRGEAAVLAVAAALTAGATATAATMAEATPAYANVPALSAPLVPGQENQQSPLFAERYPYGNPNPTAEASTSTATNPPDATSRQECINDALAPIRIRNSQLDRRIPQSAYLNFVDTEMPGNCATEFGVVRDERVQWLVQNHIRRAKWIPLGLSGFSINDLGATYGPAGSKFHTYSVDIPKSNKFGRYECTPGRRKTGAKVEVEEIAEDAQTQHHLAKPKIFAKPVKHILPHPC